MKKKHVVILSHSVFINPSEDVFGPGHAIRNFLKARNISYSYIRHSLYGSHKSIVEEFNGSQVSHTFLGLPEKFPGHLRYPFESISTIRYLMKKEKATLLIGINPLNAITGITIKKIGKADSVIFYTADFAYKRFNSRALNMFYHMLDREALKRADSVWNVSSRIQEVRSQQGVVSNRNKLVPNTPMYSIAPFSKIRKTRIDSLVLTANFTPAIDYELIVYAIAELKKKYPNILLSFIGSGVREKKIRSLVKKLRLTRNIVFLGYKPREEVLEIVRAHAIGLAVYANEWPWVAFGDSMKAREYLALGLPVIITNNLSTADDIERYRAGFSINLKKEALISAITTLISNEKVYALMRRNALKLAKDFDFEAILEKELFEKYLR